MSRRYSLDVILSTPGGMLTALGDSILYHSFPNNTSTSKPEKSGLLPLKINRLSDSEKVFFTGFLVYNMSVYQLKMKNGILHLFCMIVDDELLNHMIVVLLSGYDR